jgi:hypothetical protein
VGRAEVRLEVLAHRSGSVAARLADGEQCTGQFNTVPDAMDSWDDDQKIAEQSELTQVGMLVLSCPSGLLLRCDFARDWDGDGSGVCRDRSGRRYGLYL